MCPKTSPKQEWSDPVHIKISLLLFLPYCFMGSHILFSRYFVRDVQLFPCCFDPSPTHIQFKTQEGNSFMTVKIIGNGACTLTIKGIFTIGELLLQKSILLLLLITLYCKKFSYDKPWFNHEKLPRELLRNSSVSQRNQIYRKKISRNFKGENPSNNFHKDS